MPPQMQMGEMGQGMPMMPGAHDQGTNLLEILINIAFGFVVGLIIFLGWKEVIAAGSNLATQLFNMSPQGQQMAAFGMAANYAPYVVLAPLGGMVVKQLTAVRSLKTFAYFVLAVLLGIAIAFFAKGYIAAMM